MRAGSPRSGCPHCPERSCRSRRSCCPRRVSRNITGGLEARVPAVRAVPSVLAVRGVPAVRGVFHEVENSVFR
ncbi:MAG: hypothetical protein JNL64_14185, partial [Blastocatellia bacterium]|nr:hypothetical protein [Blastocatellia bacterium]